MGMQVTGFLGASVGLAAGMLLTCGALLLARWVKSLREARIAAEWDPY